MKLLFANWKAFPQTSAQAKALCAATIRAALKHPSVRVAIFPPLKFLDLCRKQIAKTNGHVLLGVQDMTQVAAEVRYVFVGHSDRRYKLGESDAAVNQKLKAALKHRLTPVLLIGDRTRRSGLEATLTRQLTKGLAGVKASDFKKILIAYEPVWAVSTNKGGHPATTQDVSKAISVIKKILHRLYPGTVLPKFLYGGSVNAYDVSDFVSIPGIAGVAVGHASVQPKVITKIIINVAHRSSALRGWKLSMKEKKEPSA